MAFPTPLRLTALLTLFCLLSISLSAQVQSEAPLVTISPVYVDMDSYLGPPADFRPNEDRNVQINVVYSGFTAEAQVAFQYAVDIWSSLLTSSVPINVDATWEDLGSNTLGAAGAYTFMTDFTGAEESNTFYPIGLANKLAGFDLLPGEPDIVATFSSTANWYFGTDGNCPAGLFDFVSVVLHELGHGLGFQGSASIDGTLGYLGLGGNSLPIIYDHFVETGSGTPILNFVSGTSNLGNQLTGNDLLFTGASAEAANGSVSPELYAPSSWNQGSSYSHFDENYYGSGSDHSLMTPFIGQAEVIHNPGSVCMGLLDDIGWDIETIACLPQLFPVMDGGCEDNGEGLLPVITIRFEIDGSCQVEDLCWGIAGATPECVNLPDNGFELYDGESINLINTTPDAIYEVYFTTQDGTSSTVFYTNGNCLVEDCLPINLAAEQADCADNGEGLLPVIAITFDIDGDCQAEDLCWGIDGAAPECVNLPDNGFNLFDGEGINLINTTPNAVYEIYYTTEDGTSSSIFFTNGNCDSDQCLPANLSAEQADCADNGEGLLPVIAITFDIDGECQAEDLCWGIDGAAPECVNLPDNGFNLFDGEGINLINTTPNAVYEIYYTTEDGTSSSIFFTNGNCDPVQCLPASLSAEQADCADNGEGLLPVIEITFDIDGECQAEDLCWGIDGAAPECVNLPDNGFNLFDGEGINLINTTPNGVYEIYYTTEDGTSSSIFFTNGNCGEDVEGCTDPIAINYNPAATIDDGSCEYECVLPTMVFTPFCDEEENIFFVEIDVTQLGNSAPYTVANTDSPTTTLISSTGTQVVGPFDSGTEVVFITTSNENDDCITKSEFVTLDCNVGLEDLASAGFSIYPNPFENQIQIVSDSFAGFDLSVYDAIGQKVIVQQVTSSRQTIETSSLPAGIYHLQITDGTLRAGGTFIKR